MLTAHQVADYADVIFRWIARRAVKFSAYADKAHVLARARWLCIPSSDYDYYAKAWDSDEHKLYVSHFRLERILLYRSPGQSVHVELEGLVRDTESHSVRFAVKTRLEVATQIAEHLFPNIDPAIIYQDASDPPQTFETIQDRLRYAEATIGAVLDRDRAYATKGMGVVIRNRRVEKRLVFRNRGAWQLRLSVELMDDDTYECSHDAGKFKATCAQAELSDAVALTLSNGFAEAIRKGRKDDPERRLARFLCDKNYISFVTCI